MASLRSLVVLFPRGRRLHAVIDAYATLVPADAWAFSYQRERHAADEFVSGDPRVVPERIGMVRAEVCARGDAPASVAAPATRTTPYSHGLAVHLDDERGGRGALLLLREATSGEFVLDDRAVLAEARGEVVRALEIHANFEGELTDLERARTRTAPGIVLLDESLAVEYVSKPQRLRKVDQWNLSGGRLPIPVERSVREITAAWSDPAQRVEGAFMPSPDMVVRVVPVERTRRYGVALLLEPYESRAPLSDSIRRFRLTNRELEVIALLFSGLGTPAIAARLSISDATVNDHVRRLLGKTGSANRTEMAAKLLGWRGDHRIDVANTGLGRSV